jgi:cell division protease FtsH
MKKIRVGPDVDPKVIARGTPGFSGADLANIVNEAALLAARAGKRLVTMSDFESAKDKVMMGVERRSMVMTEEEKRLTAYHEAGHAIVAWFSPPSDPIHKATIIPRGRALGMVMRLPEGDRISLSRAKLEADLAVAMGGRVAEEIIFGIDRVTTGASSDIKMATDIARRMVTEWGMSEKLGPLLYGEPSQEVFLGHSVTQHKNMSDATAAEVDSEVRRIVDTAYATARQVLTENLDQLHTLGKGLLEYETLSGEEINALLRGEPIIRTDKQDTPPPPKQPTPGRRASVPTSGSKDSGGFEPEPQPGT